MDSDFINQSGCKSSCNTEKKKKTLWTQKEFAIFSYEKESSSPTKRNTQKEELDNAVSSKWDLSGGSFM